MPVRTWTEDDLRAAIATSTKWREVADRLGFTKRTGTTHLKSLADTLGIDYSHFRSWRTFTDEDIAMAAERSGNLSEMAAILGVKRSGGSFYWLKGRCGKAGVEPPRAPRRGRPHERRTPESVLVRLGPEVINRTRGARLRSALLELGLGTSQCAECGLCSWMGAPIPLEVDHIDGNWRNNLVDNLRLLCRNCHALTDTFGSRAV